MFQKQFTSESFWANEINDVPAQRCRTLSRLYGPLVVTLPLNHDRRQSRKTPSIRRCMRGPSSSISLRSLTMIRCGTSCWFPCRHAYDCCTYRPPQGSRPKKAGIRLYRFQGRTSCLISQNHHSSFSSFVFFYISCLWQISHSFQAERWLLKSKSH